MPKIRRVPRRDSTAVLLRQREKRFPAPRAPREPSHRAQESRSWAARERLLSATIEVLIDREYNGLTTKQVSEREWAAVTESGAFDGSHTELR